MTRGALVLVSILLGATALSASAATEQNPRVIPGRSIGNVSLGMTVAQVRKAIGRPTQVEHEHLSPSRFLLRYSYEARHLSIVFYGGRATSGRERTAIKPRVTRIETTSEGARLDNGIGVGTRERRLMRTYGKRLSCPPWQTSGDGRVSEYRSCFLRAPGNAVTEFASRIPPQGYRGFGIITASDIPKARVSEIIVRRAAQ